MSRGPVLYPKSIGLTAFLIATSTLLTAQSPPSSAETALASAREALGGARVTGVRSLLLQGESQTLNLVKSQLSPPALLEIRVLLPDHYLRIEQTETIEQRWGFRGQDVLNAIKPLKPDVSVGGSWGPEQIKTERYAIARLVLGLLARPDMVPGLRPTATGRSSVTFEAPDGFAATLELDTTTHVPVRLRYRASVRLPPPPGQPIAGLPPSSDAEVTFTFDDRRAVAGVLLPHRVTTTAKDFTLSQLRFQKILVNPSLTSSDFTK